MISLSAVTALCAGDELPIVHRETMARLSAAGDLTGRTRVNVGQDGVTALSNRFATTSRWAKDLVLTDTPVVEGPENRGQYASASELAMEHDERGAARCTAIGEWTWTPVEKLTLVEILPHDERPTCVFEAAGYLYAWRISGRLALELPGGARNIGWDAARGRLRYSLPVAAEAVSGEATAPKITYRTKNRLMSAVYKVYASSTAFPKHWFVEAVVQNTGTGLLRDVGVRFQATGYAPWSEWETVAALVPGQTVVVRYHPVLDRRLVDLGETTTIETPIDTKWTTDRGADSAQNVARVTVLGGHEYFMSTLSAAEAGDNIRDRFETAPLIAAWVTRDDLVVKEFAMMANRNAQGAGASTGDAPAMRAVRACYELMLLNDFAYKSPPSIVDNTISFDDKLIQNVKFPRDVLRDKAGTCIDLAILQAAMYHQVGLKPYLAFIPGHCFPVVKLPSGKIVAVEATGIRGGVRFGRLDFNEALRLGNKELEERQASHEIVLVDVRAEWGYGVAGPELETLPPDILARWGISEKGVAGLLLPESTGPKVDPKGFAGRWEGTLEVRWNNAAATSAAIISVEPLEERFRVLLVAEVRPGDGVVRIEEEAIAEDQDGTLVFQGTKRYATDAVKRRQDLPPCRGAAKIVQGKLVGSYGSDDGGFSKFSLERK